MLKCLNGFSLNVSDIYDNQAKLFLFLVSLDEIASIICSVHGHGYVMCEGYS